jgi:hypothetical protein
MVDKTHSEIVALIILFWIFNSVLFVIGPLVFAIGSAIYGPFYLLKPLRIIHLRLLPLYLISLPILLILFVNIATIVSGCLILVATPLLTFYCPYMALRIIYYSLKTYD